MSDIFISYSRRDQRVARLLVEALEKRGASVWWDPEIRGGSAYAEVIAKAVEDAKCVVVLWSPDSIASEWVQIEAAEAKRRKTLVPAQIEHVIIPFEFRHIQTTSLIGWDGDPEQAAFHELLRDIEDRGGLSLGAERAAGDRARERPDTRGLAIRTLVDLLIGVGPTIGLLVIAYQTPFTLHWSVSQYLSVIGLLLYQQLLILALLWLMVRRGLRAEFDLPLGGRYSVERLRKAVLIGAGIFTVITIASFAYSLGVAGGR